MLAIYIFARCRGEKLLFYGGQIIRGRNFLWGTNYHWREEGDLGEHWVQYRFSILGWGGSSFISILSVSWSILVEVLEDIGRSG